MDPRCGVFLGSTNAGGVDSCRDLRGWRYRLAPMAVTKQNISKCTFNIIQLGRVAILLAAAAEGRACSVVGLSASCADIAIGAGLALPSVWRRRRRPDTIQLRSRHDPCHFEQEANVPCTILVILQRS